MAHAIGSLPQVYCPMCYHLLGIANSMNCSLKSVFFIHSTNLKHIWRLVHAFKSTQEYFLRYFKGDSIFFKQRLLKKWALVQKKKVLEYAGCHGALCSTGIDSSTFKYHFTIWSWLSVFRGQCFFIPILDLDGSGKLKTKHCGGRGQISVHYL